MSVKALEKVALVNVDLSIWSAYKRTSDTELAKIGASLPKDSPLTKGGKKIFPTEFLAEFGNIRKEISRKLSTIGVAAMGGSARAVPESQVDDINAYMEDIKVRFNKALVDFDLHYDVRMKDYLDSLKDTNVRSIIEASKLDRQEATSKFGINWQVFKIVPAGNADESSKSLVIGMANTLLDEVAEAAKKIFESSFMGKPKVTQKALRQVVSLRDKMAGLNFLDPANIDAIVKSIDETLAPLPPSGWIEGADLDLLTSVIFKLSNADMMLQHAKLISEGLTTQEAIRKSSQANDVAISTVKAKTETVAQPDDANGNLFADGVAESVSAVDTESVEAEAADAVTVETEPVDVEAEKVQAAEPVSVDSVSVAVESQYVADVVETPDVTVAVTVVDEAQVEVTEPVAPETVEVEHTVENQAAPVKETEPEKPKSRPAMSKAAALF